MFYVYFKYNSKGKAARKKMKKCLCIYGNSGVGRELVYLLTAKKMLKKWDRLVFINDLSYGTTTMGHSVISFEESITLHNLFDCEYIIAVGEPALRKKLYEKLQKNHLAITSINGSDYVLSDSSAIGIGSILHLSSVVTIETAIGHNCFINKGVIIGHNVSIGDHSVLSPHVTVGGYSKIGESTYIGSGAVIRDKITIGNHCIIGMGAVVTKDVNDNEVVVGNPAKHLRYNTAEKVFK